MPTLYIIAGPNGAGKSTLSTVILNPYQLKAFDWDAVFYQTWRKFDFDPSVEQGIRENTGKKFAKAIQQAFKKGQSFAYETNFHDSQQFKWIVEAKQAGFKIALLFLYMPDIHQCIKRVAIRVIHGGHEVSNVEIEKRYNAGLANLKRYAGQFDSIQIFDASNNYKVELFLEIQQNTLVFLNKENPYSNSLLHLLEITL